MTLAQPVQTTGPDGEPPTHFSLILNEERTQRIEMSCSDGNWIISTAGFKQYEDYDGSTQLSATFDHDILRAKMYAGQIYVWIEHGTFVKSRLRRWERDIIKEKKFRDFCNLFSVTPEDLQWKDVFTPSFVSERHQWTEPIDISYISLDDQAEEIATQLRSAHEAMKWMEKHHPTLANNLTHAISSLKQDLLRLLEFRGISTRTNPDEIPKWAWKGSWSCTSRLHKQLADKYVTEGIIERPKRNR